MDAPPPAAAVATSQRPGLPTPAQAHIPDGGRTRSQPGSGSQQTRTPQVAPFPIGIGSVGQRCLRLSTGSGPQGTLVAGPGSATSNLSQARFGRRTVWQPRRRARACDSDWSFSWATHLSFRRLYALDNLRLSAAPRAYVVQQPAICLHVSPPHAGGH
ncbi:hypothetical protein MAPG_11227 [Magnaporthiopsis poae ATCC 64411]|uniref:Uncharacterized protein n=1 Tax=Magnaporthiopsis poae (strain ATCC 64411 / 73-15) TaxID=644358 RepID=A0A0C4EEQ3_MAGP6|nr:hypothetical protein MAPG_11227 [Magnaporthiopsis poae ATCC 64411]